jgi:hypothetical protein
MTIFIATLVHSQHINQLQIDLENHSLNVFVALTLFMGATVVDKETTAEAVWIIILERVQEVVLGANIVRISLIIASNAEKKMFVISAEMVTGFSLGLALKIGFD